MEVKCSLGSQQVVAAEEKRTQRIGGCSFAGHQNLAEGNTFLCKSTMEMVKRTMKDFKNRVQEQCFTLNRSERGPCCLDTQSYAWLIFCCTWHSCCFRHRHRLPSAEWDGRCVRLLWAGLSPNPCLSLSSVLLQSN